MNPETHITFTPAERLIIKDLETLKVLADPLRLRILELLIQPGTVKQIAEKLDMPPTKLYYHVTKLEEHNLIVVVDTRLVSGILEKQYQITAKSLQVDDDLLSPGTESGRETLELAVKTLFDDAKADLLQSHHDGLLRLGENEPEHRGVVAAQVRLCLTEEQASDFHLRMKALIDEFTNLSQQQLDQPDMKYYKLLSVLFPSSRRPISKHEAQD